MAKASKRKELSNFDKARLLVSSNSVLHPLYINAFISRNKNDVMVPSGCWAVVTRSGRVHCSYEKKGSVEQWAYVIAHCLLHLGLGHLEDQRKDSVFWNVLFDREVVDFMSHAPFSFKGAAPEEYRFDFSGVPLDKDSALQYLEVNNFRSDKDLVFDKRFSYRKTDYAKCLAQGIRNSIEEQLTTSPEQTDNVKSENIIRAHNWFMNSFPLLGSLAASFEIIENRKFCQNNDIPVAAVSAKEQKIFVNPLANLSEMEARFVIAHEIMHVALRHERRLDGRDPYLWNVATDYVINGWLVEMQIGEMPQIGLLYDPLLKNKNAEEVYDLISKDLRKLRRLQNFGGTGKGDIIYDETGWWGKEGASLDDFYRNALAQGLSYYYDSATPGLLPGSLEEEIRAQIQPPISWEVELSAWFDNYFAPIKTRRTYARPSRRQAATPNIPRPSTTMTEDALDGRTFGVVIDSSGSMDPLLLARALGSVASYAQSRDVPFVRVVYCDTVAHDAGYVSADALAYEKQTIKGRGGTILQPGLDLLMKTEDFPDDGPILIITDSYFADNRLSCNHEHAYLIPDGTRIKFPTNAPVFKMKNSADF